MKEFSIQNAETVIKEYCLKTNEINPVAMALELMKSPMIRLHGPEHHYLTSAVLAAAYCNAKKLPKVEMLEQLMIRNRKIPPAVCGYYGVCGDVMAAGAFASTVLGTTYMSGKEWQDAAKMSLKCLTEVSKSMGPRCCKRTTIAVLMAAVDAIEELFEVKLEKPDKYICTYNRVNEDCIGSNCRYYKKVRVKKVSVI